MTAGIAENSKNQQETDTPKFSKMDFLSQIPTDGWFNNIGIIMKKH